MPLQIRRGTELERSALTSINGLVVGELLFTTDGGKLYIGDGATPGGIVATSFTSGDAKDAAGAAITAGSHQSISFTYNSVSKTISSTLNLSDYQGTIKADSFKGSLLADDGSSMGGIVLVDATDGSVNLDGTVKGNIVPDLNITYDIGTPALRFKDLYLSGTSLHLGSAIITASGTAIDLPLGSTLGGVPIAGGDTSDFKGNIVADDSTIIVNTATKVVTAGGGFIGSLTGNVTGSVTGNIFTNLIDSADSSDIAFTPSVVFNSDITVDNEIIAKNINVVGNITVGDLTEKIRMLGRAEGPVIQSLSEELVLESAAVAGPQVRVNIKSSATTAGSILTGAPGIQLLDLRSYKNGATAPNPGDIAAGDILGGISFTGVMTSTLSQISCAMGVQADPNGTLTSTHIPSKFFFLANANTSGGGFKFMTFDSQGRLAVNQETAAATLDVNGFAKLAVLTAAPASPANGMIAIADGTSWDPAGTGKSVMVVYLAGGWRVSATAP